MLGQGLLEDSHHDKEAQDDHFVTNSLLDLSNHEAIAKTDPFADQTRYIPRVSNMSEGDHHEYNGLYSDGGLLGNWKPPPDPRVAQAARTRKRRLICGSVTVCFMLGIVLIATIYVPIMIQGLIDESKFELTSVINITDPGMDAVTMSMDARVTCDSPFAAIINPKHETVEFYDTMTDSWLKVLKMKIPSIHVNGPHAKVEIRDRVEILSFDNWNTFSAAVMHAEEVKFKIVSEDVTVRVKGPFTFLGINYHGLSISKVLVVKAMNGLPGAVVLDYDTFNSPYGGEYGLEDLPIQVSTVRVPNYSGFSASGVGFLSGKVTYNNMDVGWLTSTKNESLLYGDNLVVLSGYLNPSNMSTFDALMSGYLTGSSYTISLQLTNYSFQHNVTVNATTGQIVEKAVNSAPPGQLTKMEKTFSAPASTEYLYDTSLQGFQFSAYLKWPTGRVNMTLENIIDISKATPSGGATLPLWIGVYNPFSANIFLESTNFNVYWKQPAPYPAPTFNPSVNPTRYPTSTPTASPSALPSSTPSASPTTPTFMPIPAPTLVPVPSPTSVPIPAPTSVPVSVPVPAPTSVPVPAPTFVPIPSPTATDTTLDPTFAPTLGSGSRITRRPTDGPTLSPIQALQFSEEVISNEQKASERSGERENKIGETYFFEDGAGIYVGYAYNTGSFINCLPKQYSLSGSNLNDALGVTTPPSQTAIQMLQELRTFGTAFVGVVGTFKLRVGTLSVTLSYFQSLSIPTCDLQYVQTHERGGICDKPPSNNITQTGNYTYNPV